MPLLVQCSTMIGTGGRSRLLIACSDAARDDSRWGGGSTMPKPPLLLSPAQMGRLTPHVPLSHGKPRVDDRRVVSGIIYVIRHGLQRRDVPVTHGPHKTLYNRFIDWSRMGVFDRIFAAVATQGRPPERLMIDSTTSRRIARPPACSERGFSPLHRPYQGRPEFQAPCGLRRPRAARDHAAHRGPGQRPSRRSPHAASTAGQRTRTDRRPRLRQCPLPR